MIFYVAHGPEGTCGQKCSEWIAAEGHVYWDTHKRLLALLDRVGGRKPPVFVSNPGVGHDLKVSTAIGRIIRERGLDVSVGSTVVQQCAGATDAACFALKRGGGPLDATINRSSVHCNLSCVLILAGGVRRSLPATAKVIISGMRIMNRLGLNVSEEHREGLTTYLGDQFKLYLTTMGVDPELVNIMNRDTQAAQTTELSATDCLRLRIINVPQL